MTRHTGVVWLCAVVFNGVIAPVTIAENTNETQSTDHSRELAEKTVPPPDILSEIYYADALIHRQNMRAGSTTVPERMIAMVATILGRTRDTGRTLEALGAEVLFQDDVVGYLRLALPIDRWESMRSVDGVLATRIEGLSTPVAWVEPEDVAAAVHSQTAAAAAVDQGLIEGFNERSGSPNGQVQIDAAIEQYPEQSRADDLLGVTDLRRRNPRFDGRGTTIAILESNTAKIDVSHPAFASSLDEFGGPQTKLLGIQRSPEDAHTVRTFEDVVATESVIWKDGRRAIVLPAPGHYRLGTIEIEGRRCGLLWSPALATAWIDFDQNGKFAGEPALPVDSMPGLVRVEKGPQWATRGFIVVASAGSISLYMPTRDGGHAMMTAGVAAGSREPASLAVGVAPAARLLLVETGQAVHHFLEGLILAAQRPEVDVISVSRATPLDVPESDDQLSAIIVNRIVTRYRKLVVLAAGNGAGVEAAATGGSLAISVGALSSMRQEVWGYSERGPSVRGLLKPDVVAPAERISARDCVGLQEKTKRDGLPCHELISGGTSSAAPTIAGFAALLISAGRQMGREFDVLRLRRALLASAQFLPDWRPVDQGRGIPKADRAWELLNHDESESDHIAVSAPISHRLTSSTSGPGLYFREGWPPGKKASTQIRLRRTTGRSGAKEYRLRLRGDAATFQVPRRIRLRLNHVETLPVHIRAGQAGVKSALLDLVDAKTGLTEEQIPLTVVVAQPISQSIVWSHSGMIAHDDRLVYPIGIPPDTTSLRWRFTLSCRSMVRLFEPGGWTYQRTPRITSRDEPVAPELQISDPEPGVWLAVVYRPETACDDKPVTHSIYIDAVGSKIEQTSGVQLSRAATEVDSAACAKVNGRCHGRVFDITTNVNERSTIVQFQISAKTAWFRASLLGDDAGAVSYFIYDCSKSLCRRAGVVPSVAQQKVQTIMTPNPGLWKIVTLERPGQHTPLAHVSLEILTTAESARPEQASSQQEILTSGTIRKHP